MTQEEEISTLKQQVLAEQAFNKRTLDVIELVQIRLAALDDEFRRLVALTTAQEHTAASLVSRIDLAIEENDRLRAENAKFRDMLAASCTKPVASSPLNKEELQLLEELDPE